MTHCFGRSPNSRDRIFQLKLGASKLLTPIFKFILFVRIDSVIREGPSFGSKGRHGVSPCQNATDSAYLKKHGPQRVFPRILNNKRIISDCRTKGYGGRAIPCVDAPILSQIPDYSTINICTNGGFGIVITLAYKFHTCPGMLSCPGLLCEFMR
jgi:hypothetical protein